MKEEKGKVREGDETRQRKITKKSKAKKAKEMKMKGE